MRLAEVEDVLGGAVGEVVEVLDADDRHDRPGGLELVDGDLREADVCHLPLVDQVGKQPELVFGADVRVDPVQLEQVDAVDPEAAQAHLALLAQVLGSSDGHPDARSAAGQSGLGRDHEPVGVGVERLVDEILADLGPVRVGGVDQVDTEVDRTSEDADAVVAVGRLAPDPGAGELHGAEAEAVHGVAPEVERPARLDRPGRVHTTCSRRSRRSGCLDWFAHGSSIRHCISAITASLRSLHLYDTDVLRA